MKFIISPGFPGAKKSAIPGSGFPLKERSSSEYPSGIYHADDYEMLL